MDSKKFIEIKKPVEEIREIESEKESKLEVPKVEKVEAVKENSTPNADEDDEQIEEGFKQSLGGAIEATDVVAPPLGVAETAITGVGGEITEGTGKLTD